MRAGPGLYSGISMADYLAIDALGSGRLEHLAVSPLAYRWALDHPEPADTDAMERGTALHMSLLEPDLFARTCVVEPDPATIAPGSVRPRATKAYHDAVAELVHSGRQVLRAEMMDQVLQMTERVHAHPHISRLLARCTQREETMLWERGGRLCRGRADALGDGILADFKTTRSLRDFNPWVITKRRYYVQAAWYVDGLEGLGRRIEHVFLVAVESSPPYDAGIFTMGPDELDFGRRECERLVARLDECERTNTWPGMFPNIQAVTLADSVINAELAEALDA